MPSLIIYNPCLFNRWNLRNLGIETVSYEQPSEATNSTNRVLKVIIRFRIEPFCRGSIDVKLNWKKLRAVAGVVAAVLLTTAVVVFSQNPPRRPDGPPDPAADGFRHRGPGGPGAPGELRPLVGLNLTDAQK